MCIINQLSWQTSIPFTANRTPRENMIWGCCSGNCEDLKSLQWWLQRPDVTVVTMKTWGCYSDDDDDEVLQFSVVTLNTWDSLSGNFEGYYCLPFSHSRCYEHYYLFSSTHSHNPIPPFLVSVTISPMILVTWIWKQVPLKYWYLYNKLYHFTLHRTAIFSHHFGKCTQYVQTVFNITLFLPAVLLWSNFLY